MAAKFKVKQFVAGGIYHIYNRGIEGRNIFLDEGDYEKFEGYLKRYLTEYQSAQEGVFKGERPYRIRHKKEMSLVGELELWAYCLLPNHIHLLIRQKTENGMTKLLRRVNTNYVMYFNQKYKRQGTLFSGVYKAVRVGDMEKAVMLSKYIHQNPVNKTIKRYGLVETMTAMRPEDYLYSSYRQYLGEREKEWVNSVEVAGLMTTGRFSKWSNYKAYVDDALEGVENELGELTLEHMSR